MTAAKKPATDTEWAGIDRRKSIRYRVALHLHLIFNDLDELREVYSRDVSEGGIFVKTDQPFPVGSMVQLKICLVHQDLTYVEAEGEVVHVTKPGMDVEAGMGVRFLKVSEEGKKFLKEYVTKKFPKPKKKPARKVAAKTKAKGVKKTKAGAQKTKTTTKKSGAKKSGSTKRKKGKK